MQSALVVAIVTLFVAHCQGAGTSTFTLSGTTYLVNDTLKGVTWGEALHYCDVNYYTLASFETYEEQESVNAILGALGFTGLTWHIDGRNYPARSTILRSVIDGRVIEHEYVETYYCNNYSCCGTFYSTKPSSIKSYRCTYLYDFICESRHTTAKAAARKLDSSEWEEKKIGDLTYYLKKENTD